MEPGRQGSGTNTGASVELQCKPVNVLPFLIHKYKMATIKKKNIDI